MGSALWAGISGLNASSKELDVIANNLANVNTVGFKSGTTYFADVLSQSISGGAGGSMQVGRGVAVTEVQTQFGSGSFESTGNATDVAIDGDGFFMVNDAEGATYYTRAGAFHLNSSNMLVDVNNYKVQGKVITNGVAGALGDIDLQGAQSEPSATTAVSLGANLNAATAKDGQYNTTQTVYDSLGGSHTLNTVFTRTQNDLTGYWGIQASLDSNAAVLDVNGVTFDSQGNMSGTYTGVMGAVTATTVGSGTATGVLDRPGMVHQTGTMTLTRGATATAWNIENWMSTVTSETVGTGTATGVLNTPGAANKFGTMILTRGATPADWTITRPGGYTSAIVNSADATTVQISLDGSGNNDLTLTLTPATIWAEGDTATYTLNPNSRVISADDTTVKVSLDGSGTTDLTLTLAGVWAQNDTAQYTLTHDMTTGLKNVDLNLTGATLPGGATIGSGNHITWALIGDEALKITQYASASVIRAVTSDGYASGQLKTLSIGQDGIISAFFTNGQTSELAQMVLSKFANPWGLNKLGSNLFGETVTSGSPIQNTPGTSGMGALTPNTLEMSNTDIATEFIKMITSQKAYQASARVVTTQDAIMQELMNLKR